LQVKKEEECRRDELVENQQSDLRHLDEAVSERVEDHLSGRDEDVEVLEVVLEEGEDSQRLKRAKGAALPHLPFLHIAHIDTERSEQLPDAERGVVREDIGLLVY
jgi:hypothetical protein